MGAGVDAYVGLGSNLDDPRARLERAAASMDRLPGTQVRGVSTLYRNPPLPAPGVPEQPAFVNAVARLETVLEPEPLLDGLQAIEAQQQRCRGGARWGPRTLDLDLLLYGERTVDVPRLQIPHPELTRRAFVVFPMLELVPGLRLPDGTPLREVAADMDASELCAIGPVRDLAAVASTPPEQSG